MSKISVGFVVHFQKPQMMAACKNMVAIAKEKGCQCKMIDFANDDIAQDEEDESFHLLVAIGGDGTILKTAELAANRQVPILGVNLGHVGFLSEILPEHFADALDAFLFGKTSIDKRSMLRCCVNEKQTFYGLNDIVIYKRSLSGIVHIGVHIDGLDAGLVSCDGIVSSTPTGATGYSMSAGGPILAPGLEATIITPICSHSLYARPIVASSNAIIRFSLQEAGWLSTDGRQRMPLEPQDSIVITKADKNTMFVRVGNRSIYQLIRERLS